MAIGIHFDEDDVVDYDDTLAIGIGHPEDNDEESDDMTLGIGIGHREKKGR